MIIPPPIPNSPEKKPPSEPAKKRNTEKTIDVVNLQIFAYCLLFHLEKHHRYKRPEYFLSARLVNLISIEPPRFNMPIILSESDAI
jgi:hypothetical protein